MLIADWVSILGVGICLSGIYYKSYPILLISRLVTGICSGLNNTVVPLYIKEMSPHAISEETGNNNIIPLYSESEVTQECSGKTGVFFQLSIVLGIYLTLIVNQFQDDISLVIYDEDKVKQGLYILFGLPIVILLLRLFLLTTCFKDDTPRYYVLQKDKTRARRVIRRIYKVEFVDQQLQQLIEDTFSTYQWKLGEDKEINWRSLCTYLRYPLFLCVSLGFFQ